VTLIRLIKAWARSEGRRDEEIFDLHAHSNPRWPWPDQEQLAARLVENASPAPREMDRGQ
jgi:hypothetical protein